MRQLSVEGRIKKRIQTISIYLIKGEEDNEQMYYCPYCRNALMQYKGDMVTEVPGDFPSKLPITIMCKNPNCRRKFRFINFLEENVL